MLLNIAAHNVEDTKRKSYKTSASHKLYYCDGLTFFDVYVLELLRFGTITFWNYYVLELLRCVVLCYVLSQCRTDYCYTFIDNTAYLG
jgi:hypothetical protein